MDRKINFRNEIQVNGLGQGTWNMGESSVKRPEELKALRAGIELGMTVIDTAEMYGDGRSEQLVGEAIAGIRDQVFLITKVLPSHASLKGIKEACENSLRRLKTDYIDLYLLHWRGNIPFEETIEAMWDLQKVGKIRQWGVSNMDVADMEEICEISDGNTCAANEVLYNLMRRGIEFDLLPWCRRHHMPVIAYSPVEQGRLLRQPVLMKIAGKYEVTPAQIALAWVIRQPDVLAIPKAASVEHVKENFGSLSIHLEKEDLDRLDRVFPPPTIHRPLEMI